MPALLASLIGLAAGGCESASNLLGNNSSPGPQASLTTPAASPAATQTAKIQIAPVIGSPDNVSRDLQTQLASAIGHNGVTVATAANATGEYVVRGYVVAARDKTKAKISYIWDVTDQSGKRVHRITGEEIAAGAGKDPWGAVTPTVVQSIADKTARQIASWLPGGAGGVPMASVNTKSVVGATSTASIGSDDAAPSASSYATAANPPAPQAPTTGSIAPAGPITAVVPAVTGAPGDGSTTLTAAIQRELTKNGVALASTPGVQSYKIEGKVAIGQSANGKQPIQIDWKVIDPTGKKLGTVSQKNEVPQGSLDGAWGKTADAAAAAAAQGIVKLLPAKTTD